MDDLEKITNAKLKDRKEPDAVWQFDSELYTDGGKNDVELTAIVRLDDNRVDVTVRYYSHDLQEVFYEGLDLPVDVLIKLGKLLDNLKKKKEVRT